MTTSAFAQMRKTSEIVASGVPFDEGKSGAVMRVFYYSASDRSSAYNPVFVDALIDVCSGAQALPREALESIGTASAAFDETHSLRRFLTPANLGRLFYRRPGNRAVGNIQPYRFAEE